MTGFVVKNLLEASLTIEDIGLNLPVGASASLTADTYRASRDLEDALRKRWVSVSASTPPRPRPPVWPVSSPRAEYRPPPFTVPDPAAVIAVRSIQQAADAIAKIVSLLSSVSPRLPEAGRPTEVVASSAGHFAPPPDPVFMPGRMVPESAEVRVKVASTETESDSFDESKEALSKLRKKR